jgi:hypothetical protein
MSKKWKLNAIFHVYYNQLKEAIRSEPRITPNTLQRFRPLIKFSADHHFIYLTPRTDEHQEQLKSYYKMIEEDLEEITKEWLSNLLTSVDPVEISDIDSLEAAQDTPGPSRTKKTKETNNPEEVQDIDSISVRTASITQDEEGYEEEGAKSEQQQVEVPPPMDEADSSKKRKVSALNSSSRKKPRTLVTKMQISLTLDDFDFIIAAVNDASKEIIVKQEAKEEHMYIQIEIVLQGVQHALQSSQAISTTPLPEGKVEKGDESVQLRKIADTIEVRLRRAQEEKEQAN